MLPPTPPLLSQDAIHDTPIEARVLPAPVIIHTRAEKAALRRSIQSQYSATSTNSTHSQRYSLASSIGSVDNTQRRWSAESGTFDQVPQLSPTGTSFSSLSPSSRYLLSGATSSESFRHQELSRFLPQRHTKAQSDPTPTMPSVALALAKIETPVETTPLDPWCMCVKTALENVICHDWLQKYESSSFAFVRTWKRRYVVLVDKTVHIFKSPKPTNPSKEHFLLTEDTFVFVTEEFKKGYVLELRKPLCKWYLRCESVAQMKVWLESMKKIVACIKLGHQGQMTASLLSHLELVDNFRLLAMKPDKNEKATDKDQHSDPSGTLARDIPADIIPNKRWKEARSRSIQAALSGNRLSSPFFPVPKRQSLAQIPGWEATLPPQMPPPQSTPPPVPQLPAVSEV
ncbi:hypothetical protein CLU79DRAFT_781803 [Phycomyces nitens]|nr:hypothetical protein CLU79DRAFT_781803 [Phycomyces nitens]